jgi:hypothetical protein
MRLLTDDWHPTPQVKIWFQNRRAKERKQVREAGRLNVDGTR